MDQSFQAQYDLLIISYELLSNLLTDINMGRSKVGLFVVEREELSFAL